MIVKLLTEHHLEFLNLKSGCTGSSESTLVKMPHCWKSHDMAHFSIADCSVLITINKFCILESFLFVDDDGSLQLGQNHQFCGDDFLSLRAKPVLSRGVSVLPNNTEQWLQ